MTPAPETSPTSHDAWDTVRAADAQHVWHPYTQHGLPPVALPIARASGAWLEDLRGRRILDAVSSWWVTLHGHGEPAIVEAVAAQARTLDQVMFAGFTHAPAAEFAAALTARLPAGLTRVFYSDDGSTAVEAALKIALQWWRQRGTPRRLVVALEQAYHGDTFGAMSVSAPDLFTAPFQEHLFEVARVPDPSEDGTATLAALDALLDQRGHEIAAVIVEPLVLGANGMRMWSPEVLRGIRERTRGRTLLLADEVMTGFGRTGPLFACDAAGIAPDLMALSKGITGGVLPLGVTAATDELFNGFVADDRRRSFFHGHSYTANPLACAAALASLRLLDDACATRRANIEAQHRQALARLTSHPWVRAPRVLGTIGALTLENGTSGYLNPIGRELAAFALERGVLLRPLGDVVYVLPPYCTTPAEVQMAWDVVESFLLQRG
jgi:adenosylmethionine---8-amino-7-oxononanoate aminotransferase